MKRGSASTGRLGVMAAAGKTALIVGAGKNLGALTARQLAEEGVNIAVGLVLRPRLWISLEADILTVNSC